MQDNPFAGILELMRSEGAGTGGAFTFEGVVSNRFPLKIKLGDIEVEEDKLTLNAALSVPQYGSESGSGTELIEDSRTLLLTLDQQSFYVLMKLR